MTEISPFLSFNIAAVLLIAGKLLTLRLAVLRRWSIPEALVGGLLAALAVGGWYLMTGHKIGFALHIRDFLLLVFFSSIGLKSDIRTLIKGGWPLVVLLLLAVVFLLIQNFSGMAMAVLFGHDPRLGLMVGSISLTGGAGTTAAWAPVFATEFGIAGAMEIGMAANMVGLIAACMIGGPIATFLIGRHGLQLPSRSRLDIGAVHDAPAPPVDYLSLLWAVLAVNVTIMAGRAIGELLTLTPLRVPDFVSCLLAGIILRNLMPLMVGRAVLRVWPGVWQGLSVLSDLALGLFLTMALMGLQLWQLQGVLLFVGTALAVQIALTLIWAAFVIFPAMGRDYEASVIAAAFGGISLGSTATAIANMTAVTQQFGPAHRAFIIVPLVGGFFIDLINAVVISALL